METPSTTRFAPTESEIGVMVAMWTAGIPARSSSFTIVAPQRVSVPHVEVRMTPSTFPLISFAIDPQYLSKTEKDWLNDYHKQVYEKIAPHLTDEEREWLKTYTREI